MMGNNNASTQAAQDSDDDDDYTALAPHINRVGGPSESMQRDAAAIRQSSSHNTPPRLTNSNLDDMIKLLDEYEKVALVFLLVPEYDKALHIMHMVVQSSDDEFLDFLSSLALQSSLDESLIEALCVIQNYEILALIGMDKQRAQTDYSPTAHYVSIHLSHTRKLLYRIFEEMDDDEEVRLMTAMRDDLPNAPQYKYPEMLIMFALREGYASEADLGNIMKHLKLLEFDHLYELLRAHQEKSATQSAPIDMKKSQAEELSAPSPSPRNCMNLDEATAQMGGERQPKRVVRDRLASDEDDVYRMDPEHVGIALIIENVHFYEDESNPAVICSETALERRDGSEYDSRRLCALLPRFGYRVRHERDKTHSQMRDIVREVAHEQTTMEDCSLMVIMLSHGKLQQVIGCDSVPLDVDDIKQEINSKTLEGKPKILIFQACQGTQVVKVMSNPCDIRTDGGVPRVKPSNLPYQRHIVELWATVPGYVSFRNPQEGTWMIQALCNVLESSKHNRESFLHICTYVNNEVGNKYFFESSNVMVRNEMIADSRNTLHKKLYLPPLRPQM